MSPPTLLEVMQLPFTTAECEDGPVADHRPGSLTLRYDAEGDHGTVWTVLEFKVAIAARFTPDPACPDWAINAYSRVCEVKGSPWLDDLLSIATANREGLPSDTRHFVVYFDHVGCWEVLANDVHLAS